MSEHAYAKGDVVRVTVDLEVDYINCGGTYELCPLNDSPMGGSLDYVPESKMILVRKATPPEPPVGSYLELTTASGNSATVWRRDSDGYRLTHQPANTFVVPCAWSDFDHSRVRLLTKAAKPVS